MLRSYHFVVEVTFKLASTPASVNEGILLVENDVKRLALCGFGLKKLITEGYQRFPRHFCGNF